MKRIVTIVACLFAILIIPLRASAAGGYVASRNSRVFHIPSCYHTDKIHSDNVIFYKTLDEAKRSGRRGCYDCNPENRGTTFYTGETYMWTSENPKIQNMLEDEYKGGYIIGFSDGEESGFDDGYEEGFKDAKRESERKLSDAVKENTKETALTTLVYTIVVGYPILSILLDHFNRYYENRCKKKNEKRKTAAPQKQTSSIKSVAKEPYISSVKYGANMLIITFSSGKEYKFYNVPEHVFDELISSTSKSKYFEEHIKDVFPYL